VEKVRGIVLPAVLSLSILAVFILELGRGKEAVIESLKTLSPLFLAIAFFLFAVLMAAGFKDLAAPFSGLRPKSAVALAALLLVAFALVFFVAPRTHRIYYDENIYLHIGQTIASTNTAQMVNFGEIRNGRLVVSQGEYNKQPNAYPFFLSLFYRIFGRSENLSFLINNILFALSCLLLFGIGLLLCGSPRVGFYAASVFAVLPQNILWHNTTSVEPANTFFISLTVFIFLVFLRTGRSRLFFLAAAAACITAQFRLESALIFPLLGVLAFIEDPKALRQARLVAALPLSFFLLLPHLLHIYCFQGHPWGAGEDKLSIFYVRANLGTNGLFFLNNKEFPVLLTVFFVLALFGRGFFMEKIKLLFWFLFFWGVFLFFYAGSYHYGADVRFALMAFPPFSLLAGLGLSYADNALKKFLKKDIPASSAAVILALFLFLPESRAVGEEAWAARADHRYARIMFESLPADGIVFTHNPNMFLFWGKSSAQASILAAADETKLAELRRRFPDGIYFHYNFWCNVSDPLQTSFCLSILEKFPHREILRFQERDYTYILYKIE
jgi:hypothetical protein